MLEKQCPEVEKQHAEVNIPISRSAQDANPPASPSSSTAPITPITSTVEQVTYPEGGRQAWLVVFGSFCGMLSSFGLLNTIGTLQAYLSTHQLASYNPSTIAWMFSIYLFFIFFSGVQAGPIFDSKGPRWLIFVGSLLFLAGIFGMADSTEYWHFILTVSIAAGLGTGLIFTPVISAVAHFFARRRGTATGIAATGGAVGGVIYPLILPKMFSALGFAWATRVLGFIFLFLMILSNLLVRKRLPPKGDSSVWPDLRILRNANFAITVASVFFIEWGIFIPIAHISSWALHTGVGSPTFAYQLLAILNAGSVFGRWLPGYVADRWGRFNTMIMAMALCLFLLLGLWLPGSLSSRPRGSVPLAVVFAFGFGFASGSGISLTPVCIGQLCEIEEYGRYYSTCYTIVSFGCLTGLPIVGTLLRLAGGAYWGLIVFTAASYTAGLLGFLVVRIRVVGWSFKAVY